MISLKDKPGYEGKRKEAPPIHQPGCSAPWPALPMTLEEAQSAAFFRKQLDEAIKQGEKNATTMEEEDIAAADAIVDATIVVDPDDTDDVYTELGTCLGLLRRFYNVVKTMLEDQETSYHMDIDIFAEAASAYEDTKDYLHCWSPDVVKMMVDAAALEKENKQQKKGKKRGKK